MRIEYVRVGLARAIRADNGGKVRVAKQEGMMALVGLEVYARIISVPAHQRTPGKTH